MPTWNNKPLTVYHGTDDVSLGRPGVTQGTVLRGFVVNLSLCRPLTDFGQGFYTITSLHQAREWANARVRRVLAPAQQHTAVVIQFSLDRDWLARLDALAFARPIVDFWDLVTDCRYGFPPHQRSGSQAAYDVVYGPVTIWPSRLLIQDCDQISFHTPATASGLGTPVVADVAAGGALFP
jgi:Protein of unknown function (DUF3990)